MLQYAAAAVNVSYAGYACYQEFRSIRVGDRVRPTWSQRQWEVMSVVNDEALIVPVSDHAGESEWCDLSKLVRGGKDGWTDHLLQFTALVMQKAAFYS